MRGTASPGHPVTHDGFSGLKTESEPTFLSLRGIAIPLTRLRPSRNLRVLRGKCFSIRDSRPCHSTDHPNPNPRGYYLLSMRSHTYSKFSPEMADAIDLQSLLGKLADFLLQSGFAGGQQHDPWDDYNEESDRSLEALKQAILDALIDSGQFTPELLEALRGDGSEDSEEKLAKLLDDLVQRLAAEGYLNVDAPPQVPAGHQSVTGPGGLAHAASKSVQFNLTDKAIDFLGYKSLRSILSSLGKSSFGSHDTPTWRPNRSRVGANPEFGDVLTSRHEHSLTRWHARVLSKSLGPRYSDLMVPF